MLQDVHRRFDYHIAQNFGWEKLRLMWSALNDLDELIIDFIQER